MKNWHGQLFPIVLLSLLAGLSFLLQSAVDRGGPANSNGKTRHDPDAIAENFNIVRFDQNGKVKYRLIAPYMEHYPDDDSSLMNSPTFVSHRPDGPPVILASRHGKASAGGDVVFLWEDVLAHRDSTTEQLGMDARMPDLTIQSEAGFAFTESPVDITRGNSWLKGIGMYIDNNNSTFVLQSQVTGIYYSAKAKQ
jgi:lipopolysaccharide export system protein LptC